MYCINCGKQLLDDAIFCSNCRTRTLRSSESVTDTESNSASAEECVAAKSIETDKIQLENLAEKIKIAEKIKKEKIVHQTLPRKKSHLRRICVIGSVILLALILFVFLFTFDSNRDIVLTQENQEIVELIYNNRNMWELRESGQYCYLQNVDGTLYFEIEFKNTTSRKFKISGGQFIRNDYLKEINDSIKRTNVYAGGTMEILPDGTKRNFISSGGYYVSMRLLTPSMPEYNYKASDEEKYIYIENLVKEMQDPQKWKEIKEKANIDK